MVDELARLAKQFFGFGDNPGQITIILPIVPRVRKTSLKCVNYPKYDHDVSPDDLLSAIRVYSLLTKSYPQVQIEFDKSFNYIPIHKHRVLIGGPPTNQFIDVATRDCAIHFDPHPEVRIFHYSEKKRKYEIKIATTKNCKTLVEDYCLLSKRTIYDRVEFVIGGLRAYGQEGAYYFLNEPSFYRRLSNISSAENFQALVKVIISNRSVTDWQIVESVVIPSMEPHMPKHDAFLCHSSKDKSKVDRLANRLKREGLSVWIDSEQIFVGDPITEKIEEGLANSKYVVVCLSTTLKRSNYCRSEYGSLLHREFTDQGVRVIPIEIDRCGDDDVPLLLANKRRVPVNTKDGFNELLRRLKS